MSTPILTACRQAVWSAIEAHAPLQGKFKRKYKYEDRPGSIPGDEYAQPTAGDLTAIEIIPASPTSGWVLNQYQQIIYPLEFRIWTKDWSVLEGEFLWEETIKALFQQLEPGTGNTNRVREFSALSGSIQKLSGGTGPKATLWQFTANIQAAFWNPRLAT